MFSDQTTTNRPDEDESKYEREDIQKKAFTKWINNQLSQTRSQIRVNDLFQDLRDGLVLIQLLENLTGHECKSEAGKMRVHHIGNINKVISILGEHGIKLLSISSNDIVDGNPKLTLALIWSIIQYWQSKDLLTSKEINGQTSNIEKFLLQWCQQQTSGYRGVEINDFTRSWQNGLAFNALIHKFRPDLFDYEEILRNEAAKNLEHAFNIGKNIFKIDRYLDVEDVLSEYPDKKSLLMYVMCLFQQLPQAATVLIEDKETNSTCWTNYQKNMERVLQWILKLEEEIDREERVSSNDLKLVKEQFQKHEDFMISLTRDQNQIGQVLEEGNRLLTTATTVEENEIREQMRILNRRWESLRTKSLDRQTLLHKTLMKLQNDQIDLFDKWLTQAEERISKNLEKLEENLVEVERQYRQLAQLQDELVTQQIITESLQNMVIVIDDSAGENSTSTTSSPPNDIEVKLLNLSERWANICTFVQKRWIELQEIKIELEQCETNRNLVERWLTKKEEELEKILLQNNINETEILTEQAHWIKKTESEIGDVRQALLNLDESLKVLSNHYDNDRSTQLKALSEQINQFERRWTRLIDGLQQCSDRLKQSQVNIVSNIKKTVKPEENITVKVIKTVLEDVQVVKKPIVSNASLENDFDLAAKNFVEWIDKIERILEEKHDQSIDVARRQEIVEDIKTKYFSYNDQFQNLVQNGNALTKQMKDAGQDFQEHQSALQILERRWQALYTQIVQAERELEQTASSSKFDDEFQQLTQTMTEYDKWIENNSSIVNSAEIQAKFKSFQSLNDRLTNLRRLADRLNNSAVQRTEQLVRSWDENIVRLQQLSSPTASLPNAFVDAQRKLRKWLEEIEQSLLNDKIQFSDLTSIENKRKNYKELLNQTLDYEHLMEFLKGSFADFQVKLSNESCRRLQEELSNYQDRLYDVKIFLSERLTKYNRIDKTLSQFQKDVEEVQIWIRNAETRLIPNENLSTPLETQLGRNRTLQNEIREMQTTINRLNKDVVDLTQDAEENFARNLREQMKQLNESWSHMISSTKSYSQHIEESLKRNKVLHEEIQEFEDWITDKERESPADDGPIFYQDQLRDRLEQYQKLQNELKLKEENILHLVLEGRQDLSNSSSPTTADLAQSLENLVSNWSNLQKKVDTKVAFYTDIFNLHEELKNLLHQENVWLDNLQNKIYSSLNSGADAEEISEELDTIERLVKTHSKIHYEKIFEIGDRLQATKVSLPATNSQINQYRIRWEQLHDDALKKIHTLNSQISDYQHMGHQITAMFEWMKHTDNTLNARLKDDVFADDVPAEAEKLIVEFNQYEAFLRSIDEKVFTLRSTGKNEAAKRLEQQLLLLKNQFSQLQSKFRHFQKPSDFEPKFNKMKQILQEVELHLPVLEIRDEDPDVVHNQLEQCLKMYRTLSDIKPEVEYVIRAGRSIVEKRQVDEPNQLTKQIDTLKATYNQLGGKVSASKTKLDNVERHLRKFRKEYTHINDWFVKADLETRKIESKEHITFNKDEVDWIRTTRNELKKLETNFESLKTLERTIAKETDRSLTSLTEKSSDLKRKIDQLDRRLKDRSELVEGQVRRLEDEYQRFVQIYQDIIIRLEKFDSLLSDAERSVDLSRIGQVQEELRSVRLQLDDLLNLGQDLVSKSDKYSKLVAPDIENITRKFEELQRRIRLIQENQEKRSREQHVHQVSHDQQRDDVRREFYTEKRYNRFEREARQRSPSEFSETSNTHAVIDEDFKKKYLRCLAYMKLIESLYKTSRESDDESETVHRRYSRRERPEYEDIEKIIRETEERALTIEKVDADQARRIREKIRRLRDCLENLKVRSYSTGHQEEVFRCEERYRTSGRERDFDSDFIYDADDLRSVISEPSAAFNNRYRKNVHSLERHRNEEYVRPTVGQCEDFHLQPLLRVRSLKAIDTRTLSAPSSPIIQNRFRSTDRSNVQRVRQDLQQDRFQSSISKSASMPNGGFPVQPAQPVLIRERVIDRHVAERTGSKSDAHQNQNQSSNVSQNLNRSIPVRYQNEQTSFGPMNNGSYRQNSYVGPHPTRIHY